MQVNFLACQCLVETLLPNLLRFRELAPGANAFALHLSSGAATSPYVGWDAYCISKAAILTYFKQLALRFAPTELLSLSVAPGTVFTDMMHTVLAATPADFPGVEKFKQLEKEGSLVEPKVPASFLVDLVMATLPGTAQHKLGEKLLSLHGTFIDVRKTKFNY